MSFCNLKLLLAVESTYASCDSVHDRKSFDVKRDLDDAEPAYERISYSEEQFYSHYYPFYCENGGVLPKVEVAFETWGELNEQRDNAVLLFSGLSASSHAKSHEVS